MSQEENILPTIESPTPVNNSVDVSVSTNLLEIYINDTNADGINWTIETSPNIGSKYNWTSEDGDGIKNCSVSSLAYGTTYKWYVNATDNTSDNTSANWTNKWFTFDTEDELVFTAYATLNFSGKAEVQAPAFSTNISINATTGIEETNATCNGYMIDNSSSDTTCYFELDKESSSFVSPDKNVSAGIVAEGAGFSQNITGLENGTLYYARINANNTEGWTLSYNTEHFLTKPQPATNMQIVNVSGGFNISWSHGDGYNISFLVFNTNHYPATRVDGINVYADSNSYYHHTHLDPTTTYYYRVWERANWSDPVEIQYSDGNESDEKYYAGTQPVFSNPNPANESIDVSTSTVSWNITIESPTGATFNWSIETSPNIGSNNANTANNGSKIATISGLGASVTYTVFVNASETSNSQWSNETYWFTTENIVFVPYATLTFGAKAETQGEEPILSNEQPSNASIDNDMYPLLQITVNEPQSQNFNISWSTNATGTWIFYNSTCLDGTFSQRATFANASNTTYWWTVQVNDTDSHWTNATYSFTTALYSWSDWSNWWEFIYTCEAPADFEAATINFHAINLSWALNETTDRAVVIRNESGYAGYPISQTNGTLIYNNTGTYHNDTVLNESTAYYYTVWGWNNTESKFSVINQTATNTTQALNPPSLFSASTFNETQINLTWTKGSQADNTTILRNASGYPHYPNSLANGTLIYNDTGTNYEDIDLSTATVYYYSAWTWNNSESVHSLTYATDSAGTTGALSVCCEYPVNISTEVNRPPVNISLQINGSGLDVYFYSYNITSFNPVWVLLANWSGVEGARYELINLVSAGNLFIWGNTTYHWYVNVTDGSTWINSSYEYTTTELANGANARYDVSNDDWVDGTDLLADYAHRTGTLSYDGIYDVDGDGWIDGTDLLLVYANRT